MTNIPRIHAPAEEPTFTEVEVSTAIELLSRLYVGAHASKGDFEQLPAEAGSYPVPVEGEMRDGLLRYFGADFALGVSLIGLAATRGWSRATDLVAGVREMSPEALLPELLASTTLDAEDHRASRSLIVAALAGKTRPTTLARELARHNSYARKDIEYVLADPSRAHAEVLLILEWCAGAFEGGEESAAARLRDRVSGIRELLDSTGRQQALLELTGGWTLKDDSQEVVLFPTDALGSLVLTRLLADGRLIVLFGPSHKRHDRRSVAELAAIARALGSEQRIAILQQIARKPATGQTLAKSLGLTQATVHHHTSLLRSMGLVNSSREMHSVFHSVNADHLRAALSGIDHAILEQHHGHAD